MTNLKHLYKDPNATLKYWDESWGGRNFDEMVASWLYSHTFARLIDVFQMHCRLREGMRLLDLGCGWGRMSIGLLKRIPSLSLSGIDISDIAVQQARAVVPRECGDVDFNCIVASAEQIPFDDEEFDAVVSSRVLQYVSRPEIVLAEVKRVLKPGDRATILVPNKANPMVRFFYHTQTMYGSQIAKLATELGFKVEGKGSLLFFPAKLKRFQKDSIIVPLERKLSDTPIIKWFGALAFVAVHKS